MKNVKSNIIENIKVLLKSLSKAKRIGLIFGSVAIVAAIVFGVALLPKATFNTANNDINIMSCEDIINSEESICSENNFCCESEIASSEADVSSEQVVASANSSSAKIANNNSQATIVKSSNPTSFEELLNCTNLTNDGLQLYCFRGWFNIDTSNGKCLHNDGAIFVDGENVDNYFLRTYYTLTNGKFVQTKTETIYQYLCACPDHRHNSLEEHNEAIAAVANHVCCYCGKHDCPSITYKYMSDGTAYAYDTDRASCPIFASGQVKCEYCGKILTDDYSLIEANGDKYCNGMCNIKINYNGN